MTGRKQGLITTGSAVKGSALIPALSEGTRLFSHGSREFLRGDLWMSRLLSGSPKRRILCPCLAALLCHVLWVFCHLVNSLPPSHTIHPALKPSTAPCFEHISWGSLELLPTGEEQTLPVPTCSVPRCLLTARGRTRSRFCCQELPESC